MRVHSMIWVLKLSMLGVISLMLAVACYDTSSSNSPSLAEDVAVAGVVTSSPVVSVGSAPKTNLVKAGIERHYFVAAEIVEWDFIPTGLNQIKPSQGIAPWGTVSKYRKYRYIEYTDNSFATVKPQPQWMGILGPQFRGTYDDTLVIHFLNRTDRPLSMHPHGVEHDIANDGADAEFTGEVGSAVPPGDLFVYRWYIASTTLPGPAESSSRIWLYHSSTDQVEDHYLGLIGTIVVTQAGMAKSQDNPSPIDVDEEYTALFMVFNEEDGEEPGLMHSINGYMFGNLNGYVMHQGDRVRWHLVALGTEVDLHTAHWHGNTVDHNGVRTDVIELLPASMKTVTMDANTLGNWLFHCHVADHMTGGMTVRYEVR